MGMSLVECGHLTHGMALNMSGKWFNVVSYGLNEKEEIDYDKMEQLAHEHKPKLIIAGASAYSLRIDFERFAKVAKDVGAFFMVDMAPQVFIRIRYLMPISSLPPRTSRCADLVVVLS